jgi:outer membrane protein assembly factor BamB
MLVSFIFIFLLSVTQFTSGSLSSLNYFSIGANIEDCQPWVENDIIYIGALNNYLYAMNFTGSVIWSVELDGPVSLSEIFVFPDRR